MRQGTIRKTAGPGLLDQLGIGFAKNKAFGDGSSTHQIAALEGGVAAGVIVIFFWLEGANIMTAEEEESKAGRRDWRIFVAFASGLALNVWTAAPHEAAARDLDGRYANSPLKGWFESLHSGKGPCCSDADGSALSDADWEVKGGHYRVRIEGEWWDVPDEAVIKEPNRAGRTMVWPVYYRAFGGPLRLEIRCFMPGTMT